MPKMYEKQNGLIKKQLLSWQSFRNGFIAGYAQAMKEHNVLEVVKGLDQLLKEVEMVEEVDNYYFDTDLDKIKEELKKAKAEWQK